MLKHAWTLVLLLQKGLFLLPLYVKLLFFLMTISMKSLKGNKHSDDKFAKFAV